MIRLKMETMAETIETKTGTKLVILDERRSSTYLLPGTIRATS